MKKVYVDNGVIIGIDINLDLPFISVDDVFADDLLIKASNVKVNMTEFKKVVNTEVIDTTVLNNIFVIAKTDKEILQDQVLELQRVVVDLTYKNLVGGGL